MRLLDTLVLIRKLDNQRAFCRFAMPWPRLLAWLGQGATWALVRRQEAATTVEYAIVLAMVLMATFSAIQMVGGEAGFLWGGIIDDLTKVGFFH